MSFGVVIKVLIILYKDNAIICIVKNVEVLIGTLCTILLNQ